MNAVLQLLLPKAGMQRRLRVAAIAAFAGGWGILTGFVIFICLSQAMSGIAGVRGLWALVGTLTAAVCVASIVEYLRELALGHPPAASQNRRRTFASILSSVLLIVLFESCIIAFEEVSKAGLESAHTLSAIVDRVAGRDPPTTLLYGETEDDHVANVDGLLRDLEVTDKQGPRNAGPLRRVLDYVGEQDRWRLFPATVPAGAFFTDRVVRRGEGEGALVRRLLGSAKFASPPAAPRSATLPTAPRFVTSDTGKFDEGCGIALEESPPPPPEPTVADARTPGDVLAGEAERARYLELKPEQRRRLMCQILNRMLLDPELYQARDFAALELPAGITEPLERDQQIAAELKRLVAQPASVKARGRIDELKHQRLSVQTLVLLNQGLLWSALPGHFNKPPASDLQRWLDVAALAIAWILSGAILVAGVAMVVFEGAGEGNRPSLRRMILRSVARAATLAAVVAPLAVAGYVLLTRLLTILFDLAFDRGATRGWIWDQFNAHSALLGIPVAPVMLLYWLAHWFAFSWVLALLLIATLIRFHRSWFARAPLIWLGLGLVVLVLKPYSLTGFASLLLLTALVWIVPAIILGATAPFLQPGSVLPASWGPIGIVGGLVLAVATILRFDQWWGLALPAALLVLAGLIIRARWNLRDYWPIMALVICLSIAGSTALLQQASFRGVLSRVHEMSDVVQPDRPLDKVSRDLNLMAKSVIDAEGNNVGPILPDGQGGWTIARQVSPLSLRLEEEAAIVKENDLATTKLLETVLVSALGFWAMIGLLAAWSVGDGRIEEEEAAHPKSA